MPALRFCPLHLARRTAGHPGATDAALAARRRAHLLRLGLPRLPVLIAGRVAPALSGARRLAHRVLGRDGQDEHRTLVVRSAAAERTETPRCKALATHAVAASTIRAMPVIACPDCGRDVSTLAPACPHCGRPSPGGMAPVGAAPAETEREQTLWSGTPSGTLLIPHYAGIVFVLIGIPLLVRFFASSMPDEDRASDLIGFGWIATAVLLAIQIVALLVAWLRLRSTLYTVTNQRVLLERGVFSKTVDEIDLRYVDDSQFTQTFIDRMLGIGNVTLMSSDKNTPQYVLHSVKDPRAIREMVRAEAYQRSHRQVFTRVT